MALSFYPFQEGFTISAAVLNELVEAIQDGSIFTSTGFVQDLVTTLDARVAVLEAEVAVLENTINKAFKREQKILTAGQSVINLSKAPALDSEIITLNGLGLSRDGLPELTDTADYSISGSIITLGGQLALQIQDGDRLTVVYQYEVT